MSKIKRILAVVMAMAMIMAMSIVSSAAITGASIEVKGLSTAAEQIVDIYEIYRLDANDNLWEKQDWATAIDKPEDLNDPVKLAALKNQAEATTPTATERSTTGTVTFSNLQAGAYLVIATDTTNKTTYSTMVAVTYDYNKTTNLIEAKNAEVVAKAESYSVTKEQQVSDDVAEVGDLVKYTIKTTVPYIKENETNVTFTVSDTLSGATYYLFGDPIKGVSPVSTVTVGGNTIDGISIPADAHAGESFTIDMGSLVSKENTYAGQEIVITYTAKVSAVDEITNTANSNHAPETRVTKAYTGQLEILKYGDGDKTKVLSGATFVVYRVAANGNKEYAVIDNNGYVTGEWITGTTGTDGKDIVPEGAGTVTTGDDGRAVVKGLDLGTYYFKETIAPDGYSVNNLADAEGTITKMEMDGVVTVKGNAEMNDTKLSALPATGGIGITIFTIIGCLIMIGAAFMFFMCRRKPDED